MLIWGEGCYVRVLFSSRVNQHRLFWSGETQLHIACIKNQPMLVKKLLLEGIDPNLKDNAGWTALHEACNHGNQECVAELLRCKGECFDILAIDEDIIR